MSFDVCFKDNGTGVPKVAGQHVGAGAKGNPVAKNWQFTSFNNDNVNINKNVLLIIMIIILPLRFVMRGV